MAFMPQARAAIDALVPVLDEVDRQSAELESVKVYALDLQGRVAALEKDLNE